MLACALASVAAPYHPTEGGHARQASLEDTQAAEAYFGAAQRRIGLLPPSLVAVQCHYLAGLYAKFAVRPMQAWSLMQAASAQLQALLYAKGLAVTQDTDDTLRARHIEQRLYWSCVKAERYTPPFHRWHH